jgi:hypothetical protein
VPQTETGGGGGEGGGGLENCVQIWSVGGVVEGHNKSEDSKKKTGTSGGGVEVDKEGDVVMENAENGSGSSGGNDVNAMEIDASVLSEKEKEDEGEEDEGDLPRLEMCILHECGNVLDLKWAPYGGYETLDHYNQKVTIT